MLLTKLKKYIDMFISTFSIIVMVLLVICVTWQVFSRYVLQIPSTVTDEVARFSMIWVGLLGAAYTVGLQKHLSIDLFTHNLTHYKKAISNIFINICIFLFSLGVMVFGGINLVLNVYASGQISSSMQIPMAYVYVVLPISGVLMMFYSLIFLIESVAELKEAK
ncbi:C4-dicarboxylate ABC transporter permease [Gallibacterium anatis]|uniref:TRAP transporter small permease protein n=3 Tax=Gallibacterium anatis TaxID=750 RepID=U1H271_9PAST|nr:TRAP transporter small permease [Gallibacterium anatis]ERF78526.1 C4-dicarboxylate ABC transporter permease [Gallibacterium anatis 12656/12]KGQ25315.1 C4-dicarboxylate ABC transporter permease [Gallibacterium anatis CCM5995]KGQ44999.1 C4-dicarboxylate ABC transporter permease [Gallibacterium anatis]KGQ60543.1 C4-dicarboxylate ABC transporter permease [Gallibacterium anatis]KGQ63397.1 C4-dicarboxylate ABC transporter permease [Gallibacterium anatis 7990]